MQRWAWKCLGRNFFWLWDLWLNCWLNRRHDGHILLIQPIHYSRCGSPTLNGTCIDSEEWNRTKACQVKLHPWQTKTQMTAFTARNANSVVCADCAVDLSGGRGKWNPFRSHLPLTLSSYDNLRSFCSSTAVSSVLGESAATVDRSCTISSHSMSTICMSVTAYLPLWQLLPTFASITCIMLPYFTPQLQ